MSYVLYFQLFREPKKANKVEQVLSEYGTCIRVRAVDFTYTTVLLCMAWGWGEKRLKCRRTVDGRDHFSKFLHIMLILTRHFSRIWAQ